MNSILQHSNKALKHLKLIFKKKTNHCGYIDLLYLFLSYITLRDFEHSQSHKNEANEMHYLTLLKDFFFFFFFCILFIDMKENIAFCRFINYKCRKIFHIFL